MYKIEVSIVVSDPFFWPRVNEWQPERDPREGPGAPRRPFRNFRGGQGGPEGPRTLSKGGPGGALGRPTMAKVRKLNQNRNFKSSENTLVFNVFLER